MGQSGVNGGVLQKKYVCLKTLRVFIKFYQNTKNVDPFSCNVGRLDVHQPPTWFHAWLVNNYEYLRMISSHKTGFYLRRG